MQNAGRLMLAAFLLLAVSLRIVALLRPNPINIDEARYLVAAHHLRSGVGYSDWRGPEIDIHPLHPALVAILGDSIKSLEFRGRAVTFLCSLILLWPLGALSARLGGPSACLLLLLLAGSHPWLVRASASVQPESLYVLLTAVALVTLSPKGRKASPTWSCIVGGALFGLAYLARPEGLPVGLLAATIVILGSDLTPWSRLLRFGAFATAMVIFASPYLVFLRSATGEWTVTGKTAQMFFVGQALHDAGGIPPDVASYVSLMERWKGVLPYVEANPGHVAIRVLNNMAQIGMRALPRALGPGGLAGLALCAAVFLRRRDRRPDLALVAAPGLTLLLMLFTFRNDRVIGSALPFLLVLAATGLAAAVDRLDLRSGHRFAWAGFALGVAVLSMWLPVALRAAKSELRDVSLDRRATALAIQMSRSAGAVASNNPALSFYAGDPSLFGPPGLYTPLDWPEPCTDLARALSARGARIAILDVGLDSRIEGFGASDCLLHEAVTFEDRRAERRISILAWK